MNKHPLIALALLAAACGADPQAPVASTRSAVQDFVVVNPDKDTWYKQGVLNPVDYGASCSLRTASSTALIGGTTLIHFPLTNANCGFIRGDHDTAALLLTSDNVDNGPVTVDVYEVTSAWTPGTTGASGCALCNVSTNLNDPATFVTPSKAATPRASFTVSQGCQLYKVDLTSLVLDWCNDPAGHPNNGLLLKVNGGAPFPGIPGKAVSFHSMEGPASAQPGLWIGHPDADGDGI